MAKTTTCDICGEPANLTFEVYTHAAGFRPNVFYLHSDRMAGQMFDLCEEHAEPFRQLLEHSRRLNA